MIGLNEGTIICCIDCGLVEGACMLEACTCLYQLASSLDAFCRFRIGHLHEWFDYSRMGARRID
jgi:hypothetical protein